MSANNSRHHYGSPIEEEKRKFDVDLRDIEKRISSRIDRGDMSHREDEKSSYELME